MVKKETILQVVPSLDVGGAERTTIDIAGALTREGFHALIATEGGRLEDELAEAGGEMVYLPVARKNPITMIANTRELIGLIRRRNVSLIHARSRAPAWSALFAARRTDIPFVTTHHGIYNARHPFKRFYNSVMARGDIVIANSQWTADHITRSYGFKPKRIAVIPRGLDLAYFDPARVSDLRVTRMRDEWRLEDHERVILLPGRLSRWKGQLVFLAALGLLKRSGRLPKEFRAIIAGAAQDRDAYLAQLGHAIDANDLNRVAILSDHIRDMAAAYRASDIVVSTSTDPEAFGRVPPEAAAMGRPVIATDHGGARETVVHGHSGILVPPGDPVALADALAKLIDHEPEQLIEMGIRGRAHVVDRYAVGRMCADTLALYRELLAG